MLKDLPSYNAPSHTVRKESGTRRQEITQSTAGTYKNSYRKAAERIVERLSGFKIILHATRIFQWEDI